MTEDEINERIVRNCSVILKQIESIFLASATRTITAVSSEIQEEKNEIKKLAFESYRDGVKDSVDVLKEIINSYLVILESGENT